MVIVWMVRGKIIRSVLCNIVRNNCVMCTVQCTHIWTDLTALWIGFCLTGPISLWLDSFLYMYYCMHVWDCNRVRWTWWDWSISFLRTTSLLHSVLWHCWLGHLTCKNPSPIWPIMWLVGRWTLLNQSIWNNNSQWRLRRVPTQLPIQQKTLYESFMSCRLWSNL